MQVYVTRAKHNAQQRISVLIMMGSNYIGCDVGLQTLEDGNVNLCYIPRDLYEITFF